tara:strand:- start:29 stop:313 length:285 start_codon:yes stop_codon:yes gene_type:complete
MKNTQIIDVMSIIHFFNFLILGIFIKNNYTLALVLGIIWEIVEYNITNTNYTKNLLKKYWPIPQRLWEEKNFLNRIFDLIFNMIGYYIGNKINT